MAKVFRASASSRRASRGQAYVIRSGEGAIGRRGSSRFSDVRAAVRALVHKVSKRVKSG